MRPTGYHDKKFVAIASRLSQAFPDIDLRFNRVADASRMRCLCPEVSEEVLELDLESEMQSVINEAILEIKALARLFDA